MSLLEIDDLSVAFGAREVVRDVSFRLDRGETLALVGESGSGKSLTALSLLQLLPHGASNPRGRIVLNGESMIGARPAALHRARGDIAGMIFQEPMTSLNPLHRIGRQVAEAVMLHRRLSRTALRRRVLELLSQAGFADAEHRLGAFPHQLSGGQRQRVMIAMALANDPALLIADEPTTALDVTVQAQVLELLARLKAERALALLLITHDLSIVRRYSDRVCVMQDGSIVESGPTQRIFARPQHPYTQRLLATQPSGAPAPVPPEARTLLEVDGLSVQFDLRRGVLRRRAGVVRAVRDVSFSVREGETVGLVGESGSGKTTIGFAALRLLPASGRVVFAGADLSSLNRRALRRLRSKMQVVFQDPFGSLSPRMSVGDIIAEGLWVHEPRLSAAQRAARVAEAVREVGLPEDTPHRYPHEFSGGQRQRIAIARAIILHPSLIVLDEPTSALDVTVQAQIVDLLRRLQAAHGLGYLFISHDLRVVRALAHRIVVLRQGQVVEAGEAEAVLTAPRDPYTCALMAAAFDLHTPSRVAELA